MDVLACSAQFLLKLSQKSAGSWIGPANFLYYVEQLQAASSSQLRKSSLKCFKECFSKNIQKFQKKTSAVDCNFIVSLRVKPTTLLKLNSKKVFFPEIFPEFTKKLLYFQISSTITEAYLEPNRKSMMELFGKKG